MVWGLCRVLWGLCRSIWAAPGCLYRVLCLTPGPPLTPFPPTPGLLETTVQKVARVKAPNKSLPSAVYCIEDKMWVMSPLCHPPPAPPQLPTGGKHNRCEEHRRCCVSSVSLGAPILMCPPSPLSPSSLMSPCPQCHCAGPSMTSTAGVRNTAASRRTSRRKRATAPTSRSSTWTRPAAS